MGSGHSALDRRQRRLSTKAPTSAARPTRLLGINCGEQLLQGTRRRYPERRVEVNRLRKLLADEVIAPREFGIARERLLDAIGVVAALASRPHTTAAEPRSRGVP